MSALDVLDDLSRTLAVFTVGARVHLKGTRPTRTMTATVQAVRGDMITTQWSDGRITENTGHAFQKVTA